MAIVLYKIYWSRFVDQSSFGILRDMIFVLHILVLVAQCRNISKIAHEVPQILAILKENMIFFTEIL